MSGPIAARLPGDRLHLQHGPIDLVIGGEGDREAAFAAAWHRFRTLLDELVSELPILRAAVGPPVTGAVARRMVVAASGHDNFTTPMIAVAGSVADEVLAAMRNSASMQRAYVNNGGDIALHLAPGEQFVTAMAGHDGRDMGRIEITAGQGIGGIATSGRHGWSPSLGIADSVSVLASCAAEADAAATLVANAVDLPGHPAISRQRADDLDPDSDLGARPVVTGCGALTPVEVDHALQAGVAKAKNLLARGRICGAALFLHGQARTIGHGAVALNTEKAHA